MRSGAARARNGIARERGARLSGMPTIHAVFFVALVSARTSSLAARVSVPACARPESLLPSLPRARRLWKRPLLLQKIQEHKHADFPCCSTHRMFSSTILTMRWIRPTAESRGSNVRYVSTRTFTPGRWHLALQQHRAAEGCKIELCLRCRRSCNSWRTIATAASIV